MLEICDVRLKNLNREGLLQHRDSVKHKKNFKTKSNNMDITQLMRKPTVNRVTLQEKITRAETILTGFMSEHCTPSLQADHSVAS